MRLSLTATLLVLQVASIRATKPVNARTIVAEATRAAERGTLDAWVAPWAVRVRASPRDRSALIALATAERLRYRYARAESLYAIAQQSEPGDLIGRQSRLWRSVMHVVQGHARDAGPELAEIERDALQHADTLSALEAVLARISVTLRLEGASRAIAVLRRGDSLRWSREPALSASASCRAATVYSRVGDRIVARRFARDGYALAERTGHQRIAAACLFVLATDFARSGLSDSLRAPLAQAIDLQRRTHDLVGLASSAQWAGYYAATLGHYSSAERYLIVAWDAAQRAGTADAAAWTALSRASIAQSFYDATATTTWLRRADSLMRRLDDQQGQLEVARLLARHAVVLGDVGGARAQLERAQRVADRLGEPSTRLSVLASLLDLELREGNLDTAASLLRTEAALIARYGMTGWSIAHRGAMGEVALRRGEVGEALQLIERTLDSLHFSQHETRYDMEIKRALALAMSGNTRSASHAALAAASTLDMWRASLSDSTLRYLAVQSQRRRAWYHTSLVQRLSVAGELASAFELMERRRARDLRDRLLLIADREGRAMPGVRRAFGVATASQVQQSIPDNATAIVTLDLGEDGAPGTAFVLTRDTIAAVPFPTEAQVAPHVRRLVALLEAGRDASVEQGVLGTMLLSPLLPLLNATRATRIVLIPEGVLHRVPFDALRLPDGQLMLERFETMNAPSAAVLAGLRALPVLRARPLRVLALADANAPQISGDAVTGAKAMFARLTGAVQMSRLPGARREVAGLARALPGVEVRAGTQATERAVKRSASSYDVLHFATHAVVDEWSGASAALALTPGGGEDGMLDAGEIASLDLSATLVVLSACRTVGGEVVAGEGVHGLTRAFLQAGARSVIATAWRVDDGAVGPLMVSLYESLAGGATVSQSLRAARLSAMKRGVPASVWGAFVLVGDGSRTLVPPTRTR